MKTDEALALQVYTFMQSAMEKIPAMAAARQVVARMSRLNGEDGREDGRPGGESKGEGADKVGPEEEDGALHLAL
jgi:hypothetical protein